jgi:hypothetical protein
MNIKEKSTQPGPRSSKVMVKFTGMTWLGLVLVAFGLPVSAGWLATSIPRVARKYPRGIDI